MPIDDDAPPITGAELLQLSGARQIECEIDRAVFVDRGPRERVTLGDLIERYRVEVIPGKKIRRQPDPMPCHRRTPCFFARSASRFGPGSQHLIIPVDGDVFVTASRHRFDTSRLLPIRGPEHLRMSSTPR